MKSVKLAIVGTLLFSTVLLSGVGQVSAAPGPIPATRDTNAQVKFIEDEEITDPTDPTDPDPEKPVDPVDPTDPEKPVDPGTNGPLSLDFASSLDFGEQLISMKNETYFAKPQFLRGPAGPNGEIGKPDPNSAVPNYVQVTDKRGGEKGWSLSVKQNGQFKSVENSKELTGAQITFKNGEVASASSSLQPSIIKDTFSLGTDGKGVSENVMSAKAGEGFGTWVYRSGNESTMDKSIELTVPGSTVKDADTYKTTLTWTLTDVPGN